MRVIAFISFLVIYLVLEAAYFGVSLKHHKKHFSMIQGTTLDNLEFKPFPYGVLAYIILVISMWVLIFENGHALQNGTYTNIIQRSTMYALAVYATYNLTNMTVFSNYRLDMLVIDSLWGVFVVNISAILVFFLYRRFWKMMK